MTVPVEKYCPQCKAIKPASDWHKNRAHADGLGSYCKACRAVYVSAIDSTPAGRAIRRARYARSRQGQPDMRLSENRTGRT